MANHMEEEEQKTTSNASAPQHQSADANEQPEDFEFRAGSQNIDNMEPGSKTKGETRFLDGNGSVLIEYDKHALAVQCFAEVFPMGFVECYREVGGKDVEKITGQTPLELLLNARARLEIGKKEAVAQQEAFEREENLTLANRACLQLYLRTHWG